MILNKKLLFRGLASLGFAGLIVYSGYHAVRSNAFEEGLRIKCEDAADVNQDGHLSVEEMVAVYKTINASPSERLYCGFYLSISERQNYLKAKDRFNPETDTAWNVGRPTANFNKARAEGKDVHMLSF